MQITTLLPALSTSRRERTSLRRLPAALALSLALGCGESGSETSATSEASTDQPATGDASTDGTGGGPTITSGPVTDGSATDDSATDDSATDGSATDDSATDASTAATTGEPGVCAQLCQRTVDCEVPVALEQCVADCEAAAPALRACIVACDQPVCEDMLMCTTLCAQPGDPDATPYASCEDDASSCQPGTYLCIENNDGLTACTPFCDENEQCPVPATGDAIPTCDTADEPKLCSLDCSGGQQCPDDMICDPKSALCMWPPA
ncbi:hypothetical protein [Nannocystis pusilla]|uniref:Uncharacterized protein n=1 Tax=Nannocystis pusilla TaxID=889268 RepID=A0ABS7TUR7_9BACT|nr:hypothetical protein [Nannocystis pusilla]MBZ5711965.1 hypothetical protein [Nannocystis pusilla]